MAGRDVKVRITAEDAASASVDRARGSFAKFGAFLKDSFVVTLGDLTNIFRTLIGVFGDWIAASTEQEAATARLVSSLAGVAANVTDTTTALLEQAEALQQTTRFGDDAVISAQALLATYGVLPEQLEKATQASADLAAALGIDIVEAARAVGGTTTGMIRGVSRLVPELKDLSDEALRSGEGINLLADALAGRAAAEAETFGGKLAILRNALGEIGETIGNAITQNVALGEALERLGAGADGVKGHLGAVVLAIDQLVTFVVRLGEAIVGVVEKFNEWDRAVSGWVDRAAAFLGIHTGFVESIDRGAAAAAAAVSSNTALSGALAAVATSAQETSNRTLEAASAVATEGTAAADAKTQVAELADNHRDLAPQQEIVTRSTQRVTSAFQQAAAAAANYNAQVGASGVVARDVRSQPEVDAAIAAGRRPYLGGTRIRTLDGGSRLLGRV